MQQAFVPAFRQAQTQQLLTLCRQDASVWRWPRTDDIDSMALQSQVTANATHNAQLLGAMRGAGSIFGVVMELALKLHDVSDYFGGYVVALDDKEGTGFR